MGTTATGLRYPEPTEPVNAGAANIKNLADDVTAKYGLAPANSGLAINPWGAAIPAGKVLQVVSGLATVTMTSSGAAWNLPGYPWAGIASCHCAGAANVGLPGDATFAVVAGGSSSTLYVHCYVAGAHINSGAVNFTFIATAWK
jgi:hypothetical protein